MRGKVDVDKAREIAALKELFRTEITAMKEAVKLLQANADKSPTVAVVFEKVISAGEVNDEKFTSIAKQFAERDTRTEQTSRDNKVAIDAALQAQKEAVAKSEVGFTKQIDNILTLISTQQDGAKVQIDDLKNRVGLIEGRSKGVGDSWGYVVGAIGMALGVGSLIFAALRYAQ
jgi:hypothetical protein